MDIIYILIGLALVVYGANVMTEGASGIAKRFGISEFVVGMTVVAIGTSSPELVVSLLSAFRGEEAIALGNVVGSNLFNTLVIVGVTAIITPLALTSNNVRKDIPFGVMATIVLIICAADGLLDNGAAPVISRSEGLLMLCFFAVFLSYSITSGGTAKCPVVPAGDDPSLNIADGGVEPLTGVKASTSTEQESETAGCHPSRFNTPRIAAEMPTPAGAGMQPRPDAAQNRAATTAAALPDGARNKKLWLLILMTLGGLAGLVIGGDLFLDGAVSLAHRFGISDTVIAVTIVAGGTSLPELAASVVAAIKGKPGIALGNILGSNVLNIFLVLGASATVSPLRMGDIGMPDLWVVFFAAFLLFVAAFTFRKKTIDRTEGIIFIALYIAYIVWVIKR